ncbi:MAG: LPS export ABC transporter permease LptG [Pseudomonadota bacterium]|nr:LPS export ABC transporter permease LptG [Pseudomonadota bacterium]
MSILFRYVSREIIGASMLAALALTGMFSCFEFIREISENRAEAYTPLVATLFVLLNVPGRLNELIPVAVLVGGLFAWNRLALSSEFTVMRAGGLSAPRLAAWMIGVGLLIGGFALLIGEYVMPPAERAAQQLKLRATSGVVAKEFQTGVWAKDGTTFINIREMRPDASLLDVRLYVFDDGFQLRSLRRAESAEWRDGNWMLRKVTETRLGDGRTETLHLADQAWVSAVTPDLLAVLMVSPQRMSMATLHSYIQHLTQNHQDAQRYVIAFWNKVTYPLAAPVMLLLALAFAYHPPRVGGAGGRLLLGILLGLGFHLANRLSAQFAQLQDWPAPLSTSAPVLAFGLAAGIAIWWMERR